MNKILFVLAFSISISCLGQQTERKLRGYSLGVAYNHEFVIDGYVRVREFEMQGDKMKLKDLGVTDYSALQVHVKKEFQNKSSISAAYDQFFIRGSETLDRDIAYNGTIINGRNGIDVSPTVYYRVSVNYLGNLVSVGAVSLKYMVGLVYDHIKFYIDGDINPESPRKETYESFGKQAFPYPVLGIQGNVAIGHTQKFIFGTSGTYIPKFKSFYKEGGRVDLEYKNFQADLGYSKTITDFEFVVGAKLRYMDLFQESKEDTNNINTFTAGPYAGINYRF